MSELDTFFVGQQVIYVPTHAEGDTSHPDCEYGFITRLHPEGDSAYVRYFRPDSVRKGNPELRDKNNGQRTYLCNLVPDTSGKISQRQMFLAWQEFVGEIPSISLTNGVPDNNRTHPSYYGPGPLIVHLNWPDDIKTYQNVAVINTSNAYQEFRIILPKKVAVAVLLEALVAFAKRTQRTSGALAVLLAEATREDHD